MASRPARRRCAHAAAGPLQDAQAEVRLRADHGTTLVLKLTSAPEGAPPLISAPSTRLRVCRPKPAVLLVALCAPRGAGVVPPAGAADERTVCVRCLSADEAQQLAALLDHPPVQPRHAQRGAEQQAGQAPHKLNQNHKHGSSPPQQPQRHNKHAHASANANADGEERGDKTGSVFEAKTDRGSSHQYFKYYGMLMHQQNMLQVKQQAWRAVVRAVAPAATNACRCRIVLLCTQDYVRTGLYCAAITQNRLDFQGKVVMDVGAGSGVLSLFAAQVR